MPKIHELGFALANLIAAGEVVNRPANAVKELVENSIDAGATQITVETHRGGVLLIRVSDNGCGMEPEDLRMCVKRHATSKIRTAEDIDAITTMGFRGEALAALAAVTNLRIISKTAEADTGHMLTVDFGTETDFCERAAVDGTTVIAENLFMNTPVRRKHLKKDVVEEMNVHNCVEKLALAHPEISFRYIDSGSLKLETSGNGRLDEVIYRVYGRENSKGLLKVDGSYEGVRVYGYIGSPLTHKVNRIYQTFFVNKRYITSQMMSNALSDAYKAYIPADRFPLCVLFVDVNPLTVDVNVHPSKEEVKFINEINVYRALSQICLDALEGMRDIPKIEPREVKTTVSEAAAPLDISSDGESKIMPLKKRQLSFGRIYELNDEAIPPEKNEERSSEENKNVLLDDKISEENQSAHPIFSDSNKDAMANKLLELAEGFGNKKDKKAEDVSSKEKASSDKEKEKISANGENDKGFSVNTEEKQVKTLIENSSSYVEDKIKDENGAGAWLEGAILPEIGEKSDFKYPWDVRKDEEGKFLLQVSVRNTDDGWIETEYSDKSVYRHRLHGEIFKKYLLVEHINRLNEIGFIIIDKHAAHERMIFEAMRASLETADRSSQMMLVPIVADVGENLALKIKNQKDYLEKLGYSLEISGKIINIWALPQGVSKEDAEEALLTSLETIEFGLRKSSSVPELMGRTLFTLACKAAVKGGVECEGVTLQMIAHAVVTNPKIRFCPHGRPVAYELTPKDLDKIFKR